VLAELEGKKINYAKSGKGKCIVFLHGFLENLTIWDDFARELAGQFKIIQIDLPGHGKSDVFDKVHSMSLMAGAVNTVLSKEGIKEALIIGHSMGGYVALEFAKQFREKVKGLCLFNSTVLADSKIKKEERTRVIKVMQKNASMFIEEAIPNLFTVESRIVFKALIDELVIEAKENPINGIIACTYGMRDRPENLSYLKTIDYPFLFVIGRRDTIIPFERYKDQIFANDNISVYVSANSGHMGFIEDRNGTFYAVKNFTEMVFA
jgi:pimeloyl-ACP methyl ester carboxylesterase